MDLIYGKWAFLVTNVTGSALAFRFIDVRAVKGAFYDSTFTFEKDLLELGEHTGTLSDYTTEFDQRV